MNAEPAPPLALDQRLARLSPAQQAVLEARLLERRRGAAEAAAIPHQPPSGPRPLSFAQQRLWYVDQLDPDRAVNNVLRALRLRGALDISALGRALDNLLRRHAALRTTFPLIDGQPQQLVHAEWPLRLQPEELAGVPSPEAIQALALQEARRPFELAREVPIRARLVRLGARDHLLLLTCHHIATDGWSAGILDRELPALYRAACADEAPDLPPLPIEYTDFADWQRAQVEAGVYQVQLAYWRERLADAPAALSLPSRGPRPAAQTFRGRRRSVAIPASTVDRLSTLARTQRTSLFAALVAGFAALLGRYSGEDDLVIGSPVAGRSRPEAEPLVGCFINSVALRIDLRGNPPFVELVGRVREVVQAALANQDLPFDKLVEDLRPMRDPRWAPIFQVLFALQNTPSSGLQLPGLEVSEVEVDPGTARLDLTLIVAPADAGGLVACAEYCTDLFEPALIDGFLQRFARLLDEAAAAPEQPIARFSLLTEAERHDLLVTWNATARPYPTDRGLAELFAAVVARQPDAIAVQDDQQMVRYAELDQRSCQLAAELLARGLAPEERVALCLPRGLDFVVAVLAVIKAGGGYVPLDPAQPGPRLGLMLADAGARLLITQAVTARSLPTEVTRGCELVRLDSLAADRPVGPLPPRGGPTSPAYVMYTSGSTGAPKGVIVPQRAIVRLVVGTDYVQLGPTDRVGLASDVAFDASTFELWGALLNGARLVVIDKDTLLSPEALAETLRQRQLSVLFLTTSLFHQCARALPTAFGGLRTLLFGGEAADAEAVRRVLQSGAAPERLVNGYGPTETTTFATWYQVRSPEEIRDGVPIGRPLANTRVYVLDRCRQLVPPEVVGELYVGGDGLALGYLNQPELTAERFVADPFSMDPTARLYRTGDLVRWRSDGQLIFVGRRDEQTKVRGFRVEPGEIEAVLRAHPAVREAVVTSRRDAAGSQQLIAHVVPSSPAEALEVASLRAFLAAQLPEPMLPAAFVQLEALPLTAGGKVDRAALREVDPARLLHAGQQRRAPRTATEQRLERIWAEVLGLESVSVQTSFFDLGGHSLLAAVLFARIERAFGSRLPLASLFPVATIEHQAALLDQNRTAALDRHPDAVLDRHGGAVLDRPEPGRLDQRQGGQPEQRQGGWLELAAAAGLAGGCLVPIQPHGGRRPFVCVHAIDGDVLRFAPLARHLGTDQPFYALRAQGLDGTAPPLDDLDTIAASYVAELDRHGLTPPYLLGGFSSGATIAYAMACQLVERGDRVALVALLDGRAPIQPRRWSERLRRGLECAPADLQAYVAELLDPTKRRRVLWEKLVGMPSWVRTHLGLQPLGWGAVEAAGRLSERHLAVALAHHAALQRYTPRPYPGRLTLFRARVRQLASSHDRRLGWDLLCPRVEVIPAEGAHHELFLEPGVATLARSLRSALAAAASRDATCTPPAPRSLSQGAGGDRTTPSPEDRGRGTGGGG